MTTKKMDDIPSNNYTLEIPNLMYGYIVGTSLLSYFEKFPKFKQEKMLVLKSKAVLKS